MVESERKRTLVHSLACFGIILSSSILFLGANAFAQETVSQLTDENVRAFITKTSDVMNNKSTDLGGMDVKSYLQAHLHDNARFKSKMTYIVPGYPPKETELALDKNEFIDSMAGGAQAVEKYKNEITVKDVKIAGSGKSATVSTQSSEEGTMPVEGQNVPIIGQSKCDQIIMLSDSGVIQMFNANCKTDIQFKDGM